jgi:hypothetical protein
LITITKTVTVDKPSLTEYLYLYLKHPQTLTCSCKEISVKYERFLQANYTFHQLCNSIFVTESFIEYYFTFSTNESLFYGDFRSAGEYSYVALTLFCRLMNKTLAHDLTEFYSTQYISSTITNEQLFSIQINSSFQQFVSSTIDYLLLLMQIMRDTTQANSILSGQRVNYDFLAVSMPEDPEFPELSELEFLQPYANNYSACSCATSVSCVEQAAIFDSHDTQDKILSIPGMYIGCYIAEALLKSTLEYFYNQICINILQLYMKHSSSMNISVLDSSLLIRHNETSTIRELVDDLMVEDWNLTIT